MADKLHLTILDFDKVNRKLQRLANRGSSKIARAGMVGMATPLKKSLRGMVNGSSLGTGMKRAARETIGSSVKMIGRDYGLKVGFGVGKQSKARVAKTTARIGGSRPGVGISANNIHWVVFGTGTQSQLAGTTFASAGGTRTRKSRATGKSRRKKSGASTGNTPPSLVGMLPIAILSGMPGAVRIAASKMKLVLKKQARRR